MGTGLHDIKTLSVRKYDVNFIELASVTNFRVSDGIGRKLGIELGPLACSVNVLPSIASMKYFIT